MDSQKIDKYRNFGRQIQSFRIDNENVGGWQSPGMVTFSGFAMSLAQPADHYGSRHIQMVAPAFFRMADVIRITALSRVTLYRRIAEGKFPPPVHLGGRACGWTPTALQAWVDDPAGYSIAIAPSQHATD